VRTERALGGRPATSLLAPPSVLGAYSDQASGGSRLVSRVQRPKRVPKRGKTGAVSCPNTVEVQVDLEGGIRTCAFASKQRRGQRSRHVAGQQPAQWQVG
jgi:hypothetical protein